MFTPSEEDGRTGRFLRTAFFPLLLIVLLVWLASQTLVSDGDDEERTSYAEAKELIRESPGEIERVVFEPRRNGIEIERRGERVLQSYYPGDESAFAVEQLLDERGIAYDVRSRGDSAWWSLATYLLPFVLFFGFWIFLMNQMRRRPWQSPPGERGVDAP